MALGAATHPTLGLRSGAVFVSFSICASQLLCAPSPSHTRTHAAWLPSAAERTARPDVSHSCARPLLRFLRYTTHTLTPTLLSLPLSLFLSVAVCSSPFIYICIRIVRVPWRRAGAGTGNSDFNVSHAPPGSEALWCVLSCSCAPPDLDVNQACCMVSYCLAC